MSRGAGYRAVMRARRKGEGASALRAVKIASIACLDELQGYRDSEGLTGRALTAEERAALTRREAELRNRTGAR